MSAELAGLVEQLRAAIASRRALAEAIEYRDWSPVEADDGMLWHLDAPTGSENSRTKIAESCGCCSIGTLTEAEARHTAANDPASTIRRCDAELAILDAFDATPGLETAVRLLAESYGIAVPRTVPTGTGWPQPGTGRA